jgi:N-acetyl-anhydromuramyl-L-alanine amidase AmpD
MRASIAERKYAYFVIGMDGTVWQSLPLNKWGYHAGKAYHAGLNTNNVSSRCVGIEICNAGILTNNKSWFGESFPGDQIRTLKPGEYTNCPNGGQFLQYTEEQECALGGLLLWLDENSKIFELKNVYGHDEVAPKRKTDPGGALSLSMPEYRSFLITSAKKKNVWS